MVKRSIFEEIKVKKKFLLIVASVYSIEFRSDIKTNEWLTTEMTCLNKCFNFYRLTKVIAIDCCLMNDYASIMCRRLKSEEKKILIKWLCVRRKKFFVLIVLLCGSVIYRGTFLKSLLSVRQSLVRSSNEIYIFCI